jgi:uncharacterized protein
VQTSAKTSRKSGGRSKKAGTAARAPGQPKRRRRADAAATAAAKTAPRRKAHAQSARSRHTPQPASVYSKDDRNAILLLLLPFALLLVALSATQVLAPLDSLRRQLALLPNPLPLLKVSAAQAVPASPPPLGVDVAAGPVEPVRSEPIREAVRVAVIGDATLKAVPPSSTVSVRAARRFPAGRCVATVTPQHPPQSTPPASFGADTFGQRLARAARAQTRDLVIYTDRYRQIGFPMGDVPRFYGVCTDVVIRAYRALGVDLQVLVHEAHIGTGDTSIDHRRTKTLRRFFERSGEKLPITDFAEDYLPGDIVTYYRASGRTSQTHIAIVSDVIAPSGRPMIVHNRGWGPQLEDALFASEVTGHYRFYHDATAEQASNGEPVPTASALR